MTVAEIATPTLEEKLELSRALLGKANLLRSQDKLDGATLRRVERQFFKYRREVAAAETTN